MNSKKSNHKKPWIIIGAIAIVALILAVLINNVSGSTQPIKDVADRFKPAADWILTEESVNPPRFMCIGDTPCPSLYKNWTTPNVLSKSEFETIVHNSSFPFSVEGSCTQPANTSGSFTLCSAEGEQNGFHVSVGVLSSHNSNDKNIISLSVK